MLSQLLHLPKSCQIGGIFDGTMLTMRGIARGKWCDNGWRPDALKHIADKVRSILQSDAITKDNIVNRLRMLKDTYVVAKEAASQSGFSMTPDGRIEADNLSWESHVRAHPKARPLRTTGVRHFEKLAMIFGNDHANGNLCFEANDELPIFAINLDSTMQVEDNAESESMNVDSDAQTGYPSGGDGGESSGAKMKSPSGQKRPRPIADYEKFDQSILLLAEAAKEMANLFKKISVMPKVLSVLKGITQLSHSEIKHSMIAFGRYLPTTEILLAMDDSMRYDFVIEMINQGP